MQDDKLLELTARIARTFVTNQSVESDKVGPLITEVYRALDEAKNPPVVVETIVPQKRRYTRRVKGEKVEPVAEKPREEEGEPEAAKD